MNDPGTGEEGNGRCSPEMSVKQRINSTMSPHTRKCRLRVHSPSAKNCYSAKITKELFSLFIVD